MTQVAAYTAGRFLPGPTVTVPAASITAYNSVVTQDTLCWRGPGNQYEVLSAVRTGIGVDLLGRGSIPGWYIVRNPIYNDPCWIVVADLHADPSVYIAGLPVFSPPTPVPTATKTPNITPTSSTAAITPSITPSVTGAA